MVNPATVLAFLGMVLRAIVQFLMAGRGFVAPTAILGTYIAFELIRTGAAGEVVRGVGSVARAVGSAARTTEKVAEQVEKSSGGGTLLVLAGLALLVALVRR